MKAAMKELRNDILIEMQLGIISKHSGRRVLHHIDTLYIEIEKQQIIQAVEDTRSNIVPRMFLNENLSGEQYYNKHYNNENI